MSKGHDRRALMELAERFGWRCDLGPGGHYKSRRGNRLVVASASPREPGRALRNTEALMRRAK